MKNWTVRVLAALALGIVAGVALTIAFSQPAHAVGDKGGAAPGSYSVVDTEGHNLIVTDNKTNTLYFYTIDKDAEIGSPLKMRGSVDLNQVGKAIITPTKAK
ncbi:MAG: hypothetical protein U0793_05915 [Gemmataceae bacterium]